MKSSKRKKHVLQILNSVNLAQISVMDQLPKISMTKSIHHIVQIYNDAMETVITDMPLGNITEVYNVI